MIEFVDELPGEPRNPKFAAVVTYAQALRDNPGRWAKWPTRISESTARSYVSFIRRGYGHKAFDPPMHFEAEYRDGHAYVRYIGTGVS